MNQEERVRHLYQRQAAALLSSCPSPHLSQYFSLSSLDESPTSFDTSKEDGMDDTAGTACDSSFICPCCGLLLHPGTSNTTARIRSLKRGTTRRRRCSRNKRKTLEEEEKAQKRSFAKTWDDPLTRSAQAQRLRYRSKRVSDGEAVNCVVYTCGHCSFPVKYKGVPVSKRPRHDPQNKDQQQPSKKHPASKKNQSTPQANSEKFVPLAPKTKRNDKKSVNDNNFTSIQSHKKQKRKPAQNKSPLMSFLSSLND